MNYISEIKAFYVRAQIEQLSTGQYALWNALMNINNITGWSEWFNVPNMMLELQTGLSRSGIQKARNALKHKGFIDFRTRGNKATEYKIFPQSGAGVSNSTQQSGRQSTQQSGQQGGSTVPSTVPSTGTHTKTKLDKTKLDNKTPLTPLGGDDADEHLEEPGTGTLDNATTPQAPTKESGFDDFWKLYPRKVGKQAALRAWKKLRPTKDIQGLIADALNAQKKEWQWTKDNGQFIPNPSTWLNQGRWEDDVSTWPKEPNYKAQQGRHIANRLVSSDGPRDFSHLEE